MIESTPVSFAITQEPMSSMKQLDLKPTGLSNS